MGNSGYWGVHARKERHKINGIRQHQLTATGKFVGINEQLGRSAELTLLKREHKVTDNSCMVANYSTCKA
jgi:hypothetical protein